MGKDCKILIIQLICPHYRVPFFRKLAEKIDFTLFISKGEKKGSWKNAERIQGFKHKKLSSVCIKLNNRNMSLRIVIFRKLLKYLKKEKPGLIISEGLTNVFNNFVILYYCKRFSIPLIIWDSGRKKGGKMSLFRKLIHPFYLYILNRASAIITYGKIGKDYFTSLGIDKKRIFIAQNTIDTEYLIKKYKSLKKEEYKLKEIKKELKLTGKKIILYIGALEKNRRVDNLLKVYADLKRLIPDIGLIIIGDGYYTNRLRQMTRDMNLSDCHYLGRIEKGNEIYFMIADLVVLPGWNTLATIEAMAFSKPVITVPYGGVEYEMVVQGKTGFIVQRDNLNQLREKISSIILNKSLVKKMAKICRQRVEELSLNNMVQGFMKSIKFILKNNKF